MIDIIFSFWENQIEFLLNEYSAKFPPPLPPELKNTLLSSHSLGAVEPITREYWFKTLKTAKILNVLDFDRTFEISTDQNVRDVYWNVEDLLRKILDSNRNIPDFDRNVWNVRSKCLKFRTKYSRFRPKCKRLWPKSQLPPPHLLSHYLWPKLGGGS